MICEYEAPDAEAVRKVQRTADMPFERIWTAQVFEWIAEGLECTPEAFIRLLTSQNIGKQLVAV